MPGTTNAEEHRRNAFGRISLDPLAFMCHDGCAKIRHQIIYMPSMRISTKLVPACSLFCGSHKLRSLWHLPTMVNGAGHIFCAGYTGRFEIIPAFFGSRYKNSTRIVTMSCEMSLLLLFAGAPNNPIMGRNLPWPLRIGPCPPRTWPRMQWNGNDQ